MIARRYESSITVKSYCETCKAEYLLEGTGCPICASENVKKNTKRKEHKRDE